MIQTLSKPISEKNRTIEKYFYVTSCTCINMACTCMYLFLSSFLPIYFCCCLLMYLGILCFVLQKVVIKTRVFVEKKNSQVSNFNPMLIILLKYITLPRNVVKTQNSPCPCEYVSSSHIHIVVATTFYLFFLFHIFYICY